MNDLELRLKVLTRLQEKVDVFRCLFLIEEELDFLCLFIFLKRDPAQQFRQDQVFEILSRTVFQDKAKIEKNI